MKKLIFFTAVIFSTCIADAQWTQCSLLFKNIQELGSGCSRLFAYTNNGVFMSSDSGATWTVNSLNYFSCILEYDTMLYAGTNHGVYMSADSGITWNAVNNGLTSNYVISLAAKDTLLFAATHNAGVFRSTDDGANWIAISNSLPTSINCMAIIGNNIFIGSHSGVHTSAINDTVFTDISAGMPNISVYQMAVFDSTLCVIINNGLVYGTCDNGTTWSEIYYSSTSGPQAIGVCGNRLYVGRYNGIVYRTTTNANWTTLSGGLTSTNITCFTVLGQSIYAGAGNGLFKLTNNAQNWMSSDSGISSGPSVSSVAIQGNNILAGTSGYGIRLSSDFGTTWSLVNSGSAYQLVQKLTINDTVLFLGTSASVYRSYDFGASFFNCTPGMSGNVVSSIILKDNDVFVSTHGYGIFRSTDYGYSWLNLNNNISYTCITAMAVNGNSFYAKDCDNTFYMTTDTGANWIPVYTGIDIETMTFVYQYIYAGGTNGIFRSNDNGNTWTQVFSGIPNYSRHTTEFLVIDTTIFASTFGGVLMSKNGTDWYDINDGLTSLGVNSINTDGLYLYAGGTGVWKRPLSDFGLVNVLGNKLSGNITVFPNPATDIIYINCVENATVEILNMQGQIVAAKTISEKNGSIDVSMLRSGMYTLRIKTDSGVVMRKIVKE